MVPQKALSRPFLFVRDWEGKGLRRIDLENGDCGNCGTFFVSSFPEMCRRGEEREKILKFFY